MDVNSLSQQINSVMSTSVHTGMTMVMYALLTSAAYFFLFEENKTAGWKSFIPIYGDYLRFKLFYKKSSFWFLLFAIIVCVLSVCGLVVGAAIVGSKSGANMTGQEAGLIIGSLLGFFVFLFIIMIICLMYDVAICKKYNKSLLFILGMIFMTPFFVAALAWENRKDLSDTPLD